MTRAASAPDLRTGLCSPSATPASQSMSCVVMTFCYRSCRVCIRNVCILALYVLQRVKWALEHDAEAQKIAEAAQTFAVKHLHRGARLCYYRTLIEEMGKRMK